MIFSLSVTLFLLFIEILLFVILWSSLWQANNRWRTRIPSWHDCLLVFPSKKYASLSCKHYSGVAWRIQQKAVDPTAKVPWSQSSGASTELPGTSVINGTSTPQLTEPKGVVAGVPQKSVFCRSERSFGGRIAV